MESKTLKPKRLQAGDVVGIFSPSSSVLGKPKRLKGFNEGVKHLRALGFKVKIGKHAQGKYFYSSGTPQERASDFHELIKDPKLRAILMSMGGETANEVLPLLDFELIKANPKIIIGMSDGTTLLVSITAKTGLITFYGPDLIYFFGLSKGNFKPFEEQTLKCLMQGQAEFKPLKNLETDEGRKLTTGWQRHREGVVEGTLIGGYLEIIQSLIGANFLSNLEGKILYLESMESSPMIHMRLQYLKLLGVFDKISGLILGYFPDVDKDPLTFRPIGDIVLELTKEKSFPILQVNELGHMVKNYTWPNGLRIRLDATKMALTALEECVI